VGNGAREMTPALANGAPAVAGTEGDTLTLDREGRKLTIVLNL
jgi:hypothetical protein